MADTDEEPTQPTQPKGIDPKTGEPWRHNAKHDHGSLFAQLLQRAVSV